MYFMLGDNHIHIGSNCWSFKVVSENQLHSTATLFVGRKIYSFKVFK